MSKFIYAVPGPTLSGEILGGTGLDKILDGLSPLTQQYHDGPEGSGPGYYVSTSGTVKRFVGNWIKSFSGEYFIGYDPNDLPTEKELARQRQMQGHRVKLTDGGEWLIPVARKITGGSALPQRLILGANGEVVEQELIEYAAYANAAEKLWNDGQKYAGLQTGEYELDNTARLRLAYDALGWNYRVGIEEINMLGLVHTENLALIFEAILDQPTLKAIIAELTDKKKETAPEPAGSNIATGKTV